MRIRLSFTEEKGQKIILPIHYNVSIQWMIYKFLTSKLASTLHDTGYPLADRKFKLFTFSRILEQGIPVSIKNKRFLLFTSSFSFYLSSAMDNLLKDVLSSSLSNTTLLLNNQSITLKELTVIKDPTFSSPLLIKMESPMTTYSTFHTEDKEKRTHYYHPWSKDFSHFLHKNLLRKYAVIHQCDIPSIDDLPFHIEPFKVGKERNFSVVVYKNNPIEAWTGIYKIQGSPLLVEIGYSSGLGSKNSMGFGMWSPYEPM
jgi:CRISPR-associated endoribonuclease Cas6